MSTITKDLGVVTAYGYYKAGGGTMTEAEFTQFMVDFGTASKTAVDAAEAALESERAAKESEETATRKASEAGESASTASTKAGEAAQSASDADTAKNNAVSAKNAAETAQGKAEDAQAAAETAQGAAEDAAESVSASAAQIAQNTAEINSVKENLSDVKEEIEEIADYPEKSKTIGITSSDFVQGYRHNQPNAVVKNDTGYTTTKNIIHFKAGDVFTHPTDQNVMYYFVTATGAFYETYVPGTYTLQENIDLYIDCGKSGITPQTTPDVQYTSDTIIKNIVEEDEALQKQIDTLKTNFPTFEICYKQGDESILHGYRLIDGVVSSTSASWLCCTQEFIKCSVGDVFLIIGCYNLARYSSDTEASYISTTALADLPLYSGNDRWNMWISDIDGYVRFTLYWSDPVECAVTRLNLSEFPYNCVCLGDSIFGNNQKPNDLPTYMQKVNHLMTANCGFGGTMASIHFNSNYTPLSFWSIADAISSGDWSSIDIDWNGLYGDHVFMVNVYILCHLIDWAKIRTLTVAYGTNDWNGGRAIDNPENAKDVTTFKGALRYGIEKIQSAYPKINIILLSPLYRYWSNSQDYSTVDDDSDNRVNAGKKLTDYVIAMKDVADEYHLPFFDNYNTAGINKITAPHILRDGTHLNYKYGVSMVGKHIGAEVALSNQNTDE